jgi:mandelate racemase
MASTPKIANLRARPVLVPFKFSVHLLGVTPTCHWLEFMDWAEPVIQEPVRVVDGFALIPDRPGAGITWNEAAVARYAT